MLSWLRRLFGPSGTDLAERGTSLEQRVKALEADQLEMLTEWEKTRSQVLRYMKRAGALKGRVEPLPDTELELLDDDEEDPRDRIVAMMRGGR